MSGRHLSPGLLGEVAAGRRPVEEAVVEILQHLSGEETPACADCRDALRAYPPGRIAERAGGRYTAALARAAGRVEDLSAERRAADGLLRELAGEPSLARAAARVASSPRFATFGLGLAFIDEAVAAIPEEPDRGREMALLAVVVGERLDRHRYGPRLPEDLLCLARAELADALRAAGRVAEAEAELSRSDEARRRGSGEPFYRAETELVRCRLRLAQGRPEEARRAARGVESWGTASGGVEGLVWEAIRVGAAAARAQGMPIEAAEELRVLTAAVRGRVRWPKEHRVRLELVAALAEGADPEGAWDELVRLRVLSDGSESVRALARESFLEGSVLRALDRTPQALEALGRARDAFAREGLGLEALQAGLHVLDLMAETARDQELERGFDELPDLVTADGLPEWAAGFLLAVLRGVWSGEQRSHEAAGTARVVLDEALRRGSPESPPEPVH